MVAVYRGRISTLDISPAVSSPLGAARRKVYPDAMYLPGFHIAGNAAVTICGNIKLNPDYALKKVARAFLPVMPIIAGRNARTTFL